LGATFQEVGHQDRALRAWKFRQGLVDMLVKIVPPGGFRWPVLNLNGAPFLPGDSPLAPAQHIKAAVCRHAVKPRPHRTPRFRATPRQPEKTILSCIFRILWIGQQAQASAKNHGGVALYQRMKRIRISARVPVFNEFCICGRHVV
jgi:hypothetical protein